MKIRGGDLDLVEYDFQPFQPGECIHTLGFEKDYLLTPHVGVVKATAPGRIHLTVLDMNRFAPNRPGGGGVGSACLLGSVQLGDLTITNLVVFYG